MAMNTKSRTLGFPERMGGLLERENRYMKHVTAVKITVIQSSSEFMVIWGAVVLLVIEIGYFPFLYNEKIIHSLWFTMFFLRFLYYTHKNGNPNNFFYIW